MAIRMRVMTVPPAAFPGCLSPAAKSPTLTHDDFVTGAHDHRSQKAEEPRLDEVRANGVLGNKMRFMASVMTQAVRLGTDVLLASARLRGKRAGIVCNHASVNMGFEHIVNRLAAAEDVTLGSMPRSAARLPVRRAGQHDRD